MLYIIINHIPTLFFYSYNSIIYIYLLKYSISITSLINLIFSFLLIIGSKIDIIDN